jgi:hypothetical protein
LVVSTDRQLAFRRATDVTCFSCCNLDAVDLPIVDPEVRLLVELAAQRLEHTTIVYDDAETRFLMSAVAGRSGYPEVSEAQVFEPVLQPQIGLDIVAVRRRCPFGLHAVITPNRPGKSSGGNSARKYVLRYSSRILLNSPFVGSGRYGSSLIQPVRDANREAPDAR